MSQTQPDGYLAVPPTGKGRGVLLLHAWWGLNATIRTFCDQLADRGYLTFAPDLYHGKLADTIPGAEELSSGLDNEQARADIAQAVAYLKAHSALSGHGLAVIGFSLGASFALDLSISEAALIRAVVVFYGTAPGDYSRSQAAYLGHFAEVDPYEPRDYADRLEAGLREDGRPVQFYHYPGTGHWFVEADRPDAYNPGAAALAWERTYAFLKQTL
jgi:carboxymethylenebutenolidase